MIGCPMVELSILSSDYLTPRHMQVVTFSSAYPCVIREPCVICSPYWAMLPEIQLMSNDVYIAIYSFRTPTPRFPRGSAKK